MEEGAVLVRNENDALPLSGGEKVTLLGSGVAKPVIHKTPDASRWVDFDAALTAVGFQINITVLNAYKNSPTTLDLQTKDIGEEPISFFTQELRNSFDQYKDVAIVMLSRKVKRIGVNDEFGHSGPAAALLKQFGLSAEHIAKVVLPA